jgi:hypothetical protein
MDSVFAQSTSAETDFDIMFDQDDRLIDIVAGFNEAGEPLVGVDFETLHQDSRSDKPSDFRDELETNGDKQGASNPEGTSDYKDNTVAVGKGGESEAEKFEKNADDEYQKDKLEPKNEGFNLFDDIFNEADDKETIAPFSENDEEDVVSDDSEDTDDTIEETAINLLFMEAEEGTAFDNVKDEDAEARNSKFCNCGKSDCPICGKVQPPTVQKVDLDEAGSPEEDQPDPGDDSDDTIEETAINLFFMEAEEAEPIADEDGEDQAPVDEEADEADEPSDTQPEPQEQEPNNGDLDDTIEETAINLFFIEAEEAEPITDEDGEEDAPVDESGKECCEGSDDDSEDDTIEEAAINLFFMEAESGIDKDVKKEVKEDDGEEEDAYISVVDKNKKKSGNLEYEYSDEELIDSLM